MDRTAYQIVRSEADLQRYRRTRKQEPWHTGREMPAVLIVIGRMIDSLMQRIVKFTQGKDETRSSIGAGTHPQTARPR